MYTLEKKHSYGWGQLVEGTILVFHPSGPMYKQSASANENVWKLKLNFCSNKGNIVSAW
jgi:hypothetical protein